MEILFGLRADSSNEEIRKTVFRKIHEVRWLPFATVGIDGLPSCRTIDFNLLSDGLIYFETEKGKPIYSDLLRCPVGTLCTLIGEGDRIHQKIMVRMRTLVEPVEQDDPIVEEFFARNPGTMALFARTPEVMQLFRLKLGQGEIYQTYEDDAVCFMRFVFGEIEPEKARYRVDERRCIRCGVCKEVCAHGAVQVGDPYSIDPKKCLKCGACYSRCPAQSIEKQENDTWLPILKKWGMD